MSTNPRKYLVHGLSLAAQKEWQRAIDCLSIVIDDGARDDDSFDAIVCRANCYMQIRDWDRALEDSERIMNQWQDLQVGYLLRANILSKTDEVLAAIEAHLAAIGEEQEPSEKGTVRDRSNIFSDDPLRETLDAYKEAIDKDPTHPQAWVDRGKFHEMLLNDAEALADARCATTISPDHPGANLLLSHALENHEHFSDALKALWRYIENAHEEHIDDVIEAALYIRILQSALSLDEHSE